MRLILTIFLLLGLNIANAQTPHLIVKMSGNGFYVMHKVQPKENWYSIGRIYEISPKEIAPYNGITLETGLRIGQELKVPLMANNFDQDSDAPSGSSVVHVVDPKETLYHIASEFGVSLDKLKKWNGLKTDQVKPGTEITIGFIHSTGVVASASQTLPANSTTKESNQSVVKQTELKPSIPVVKQTEIKPSTPIVKTEPKEEPVKPVAKPAIVEKPIQSVSTVESKIPGSIGYFSGLYQQQSKEGKIQGLEGFIYGFFKSTSGWEDQKYYVLLNDVVPGTIVKITVRGTEKSIFAKVLGTVPAGKESEGMSMRMSNASAAALGIEDASAGLQLAWYK